MYDVDCPYCDKKIEINHDDGYGYEEGEIHEQECKFCNKIFIYTTAISFYHDAKKAPCKNDGKHKWIDITGYPEEYFKGKQRCSVCDERRTI